MSDETVWVVMGSESPPSGITERAGNVWAVWKDEELAKGFADDAEVVMNTSPNGISFWIKEVTLS